MRRIIAAALSSLTLSLSGCAIVELGVRNPVPGLETVAIVPFFNLSQDRTVDGREFALAYYSELQKVPGFEVLPVGVAERAIFENQLEMNGPEDALALAKILDVDAVVVGAVTDFDAYNPRIGLKISWYSPQQWLVLPNAPGKRKLFPSLVQSERAALQSGVPGIDIIIRAQSSDSFVIPDDQWIPDKSGEPEEDDATDANTLILGLSEDATTSSETPRSESGESAKRHSSHWSPSAQAVRTTQAETPAPREFQTPIQTRPLKKNEAVELLPPPPRAEALPLPTDIALGQTPEDTPTLRPAPSPVTPKMDDKPMMKRDPFSDLDAAPDRMLIPRRRQPTEDSRNTVPALVYDEQIVMPATDAEFDPHEPLMAYVRIFDSTDRRLVSRLADYLELSGESRSGDLEAWMQRTEFFRKFTAHVMISEMLALHGGESRRRLVLKPREYR